MTTPMIFAGMMGSGGVDIGDNISNSLMLDSSASQYLSRTPAAAGNRKTWVWSGWVKRGALGTYQGLLQTIGTTPSNYAGIRFTAANEIQWFNDGGTVASATPALFRDPSAPLHVVCICDTTLASATDRIQVWVNGARQTLTGTQPAQNADTQFNSNVQHSIGCQLVSGSGNNFFCDGYLSNVHFIDGQALTPSSFGRVSADTGQWVPKNYTGTYGTNGFKLDFTNGAALGTDSSGNGNNWTLNGGITSANQYIDTPTNNFAVLNPLGCFPDFRTNMRKGNTQFGVGATANLWMASPTSIPMTDGKWYWEVPLEAISATNYFAIGLSSENDNQRESYFPGYTAGSFGIICNAALTTLSIYTNGAQTNAASVAQVSGDVVQVAFDADTRKLWFGFKGTWLFSGDPVSGTSPAYTPSAGGYVASVASYSTVANPSRVGTINFGARPFTYTPPAGFKALCTANLPTPSIIKPAKHFNAKIWTSNGGVQSITGEAFQPDLVWTKGRSSVGSHVINDSARGAPNFLCSNTTAADTSAPTYLTSFNADGFSLGAGNFFGNLSPAVSWLWKAGGAAVANNAGSIASQVSANVQAGFSIVTYTGTGANGTVGHGLGKAPGLIIVKNRDIVSDWLTWHGSFMARDYIALDLTSAKNYAGALDVLFGGVGAAPPSTSVFTLGSGASVNDSAKKHVAYCFAEIEGYSKIGSYIGNALVDGPFVYCGFKPRFVMSKRIDAIGHWLIVDSQRDWQGNPSISQLYPNITNVEGYTPTVDFTATGFKIRTNYNEQNGAGATHIFIAIAEAPTKYATGR